MMICTLTGFAESIDVVSDKDLSQIQVEGSYDSFLKDEYVMLQILYPGRNISDISDPSGQSDVFRQITQTMLAADGSFSFEPIAADKSGEYTVIVTREKDGSKTIAKTFIPTPENVSKFLSKVNTGGIGAAITEDIARPSVGLDNKFYTPLSVRAKARITETLEEEKPFASLKEFERSFLRATLMEYLLENRTGNVIGDALGFKGDFSAYHYTEQLKNIMDFSNLSQKSVGKKLTALTDAQLAKAGGYVAQITFKDEQTFRDAVAVGVIKTAVAECSGWNEITAVINGFEDVLTAEAVAKYKTSADKTLNLKIAEGGYTTVSELCGMITSYTPPASSSGGGGSGGGSGGSGGGGGSSTSLPSVAVGSDPSEEPIQQSAGVFSDLDGTEWAKEAVYALYGKGIVSGKTPSLFAPEDKILREEFTKLIVTAAGLGESEPMISFDDVAENAWYYGYVNSGFVNGLIFGMSDSEFGSGRNITRQDMMVLLYRLAEKCGVQFSGEATAAEHFDDFAEIADYAAEAINELCEKGIISGSGDNLLHLNDSLTRAEAAQAIYNLMIQAGRI